MQEFLRSYGKDTRICPSCQDCQTQRVVNESYEEMVALQNVIAERKAGYGVADDSPEDEAPLPFSCSTNLSNDVIEHIGMLGPGPLALRFLTRMHRRTFGDAGDHRKNNESFLSCVFDLAGWATALGCNRSNLLKTRAHLEESQVFTFAPDETPGRGKLTWNIRFEEWTYYHRRVAKRQRASLVLFPDKTELTTLADDSENNKTELSSLVGNRKTELSLLAGELQNRTKDASLESATGQVAFSLKKEYEEKDGKKGEPAVVLPIPVATPKMPSSAPPGHTYEEMLEMLRASAGWRGDAGKDLLLQKSLQHYPVDWLYERATDYALAAGTHNYTGFKNWCASPRCQEKLRAWEQEQTRKARAATAPALQVRSRKEEEDEEDAVVARQHEQARARFGRQQPQG